MTSSGGSRASSARSACCTRSAGGCSSTTPRSHPALAGLGTLAYAFGLRHAFDADHIAAIDNTTRKMLQEGKRPLGVGFFFSLGHSTIVFALAVGLAVAARAVDAHLPAFQS